MKMFTFAATAALVMASTAAQAASAISLEIDGHKIRIEAPKNCDALTCLKITGLSGIHLDGLNSGHLDDDDAATSASSPVPTPAPPPAPSVEASTPQTAPAATNTPASPDTAAVATAAPAGNAATPVGRTSAAAATPAASPATTPAPQPVPVTAAPAPAPTTPLGLWATEENKGNVRIENCGANLCGFAEKTGEKILINMKPSANKWVGRIHDPDGGGNYDSTIAMKGPNLLKVQGCAFGGLFCGGQTWKRVS